MYKIYALFDGGAQPFLHDSANAHRLVAEQLPNVVRYRQFARAPEQLGDQSAPVVGSAEFWVETQDDCIVVREFLAGGGAADAEIHTTPPNLVEHCEEHNIMGTAFADSGFKCTFLFNRKPGMALAAFHEHWLYTHGPIAALTQGAERYVQSHITAPDRTYDGITELFWADHATAVASMASDQMRTDQANDAQNFVDGGSLVAFLATEVP